MTLEMPSKFDVWVLTVIEVAYTNNAGTAQIGTPLKAQESKVF